MKKLFTLMLMSICMVLTANAELGKLYVIGDCNSWNTSQSDIVLTETEEGSKIFVGENISLNAGYFTILQNLGDSWVDVNATRIGPSNQDEMIAINEECSLTTPSSNSWALATAGTFTITVNLNTNKIKLYDPNYVKPAEPEGDPECIYVVGNKGIWNAESAEATLEKTQEDGIYEGDVECTNTEFTLCSMLGSWPVINAHRFSPANDDFLLTDGTATEMLANVDKSWKILFPGTYHFIVDIKNLTIKVTSKNIDYPDALYILGNDGVWNPSTAAVTLSESKTNNGIYEGTMECIGDETCYFYFTTALGSDANDWNPVNSGKLGTQESEKAVNITGQANTLVKNGTTMEIAPGKYNVKVDLVNMKLYITAVSTGINGINAEADNAPAYNLAGVKAKKGLVIKNNKKYILR